MNRRSLVSCICTGAISAIAGCANNRENESSTSCIHVEFHSVDTEAIASQEASGIDDMPQMMKELAVQAAKGDEPMVEMTRGDPLGWLSYLEKGGKYYKISEEVVDEGRISGPKYELSFNNAAENQSSDDVLSFDNLPRHDQWRVNEAADFSMDSPERISETLPFVAGYLDSDNQEESTLAVDINETALEVNGSVGELRRTGEGENSAQQFRYTAETVFEDDDSFSDYVLDRRGYTSFEPSDDIQMLLDEVKENDGRVVVCDDDASMDEDEEAAEQRSNAASELMTLYRSLESKHEEESDSERLEYVQYEKEWHRISVSRSV